MTFVKTQKGSLKLTEAISSCSLLRGIPEQGLCQLVENAGYVKYKAGDILNHEGDLLQYCPLIISGQIEVFRISFAGDEKIFGIFGKCELVAIAAVFMSHNRYPMNLRAREDGEALLLNKKDILHLCHCYPSIMQSLLTHFCSKLYEHINHIDWLTSSSAEQRLAAYLLELIGQQQTTRLNLPISRLQLAARLGIRYETLSRLLSGWRVKGIINIDKNNILIKKSDYLNNLASFSIRPF